MLEVTGTVTNGVVVLDVPGILPEGALVRIVVEDGDAPTIVLRQGSEAESASEPGEPGA